MRIKFNIDILLVADRNDSNDRSTEKKVEELERIISDMMKAMKITQVTMSSDSFVSQDGVKYASVFYLK
jgi:tetrahydromethanopterin S-methyltransferase subunit B